MGSEEILPEFGTSPVPFDMKTNGPFSLDDQVKIMNNVSFGLGGEGAGTSFSLVRAKPGQAVTYSTII